MSERRLRIALALLALTGLAIASYLTILHYEDASPVCVGGGASCEKVQESDYAELAGVPVAVLGLAGYALLLISALVPGDFGRLAGAFLALVGLGFSVYLTWVELFEIEAICQWCVASAVVMALIAGVAVARVLRAG